MPTFSIGFDFGTELIRVVLVDIRTGSIAAHGVQPYPREPDDWLDAGRNAGRDAVSASGAQLEQIIGIGVAHCGEPELALRLDASALASRVGLRPEIAVSEPIIGSHALLPAAGIAAPSTVLMFAGSARTHLMNSRIESASPGISQPVRDGILPGYFAYEFTTDAIPQENDPSSTELAAFQLRLICKRMRDAGVPVRRFVVAYELFEKAPLLMQTYSNVLDARIKPASANQSAALGAAILGCIAAPQSESGFASMSQIIHAMAPRRRDIAYRPDLSARKGYDHLFEQYQKAGNNIPPSSSFEGL